jgi:plasmid maintenance system antidote protein VapI
MLNKEDTGKMVKDYFIQEYGTLTNAADALGCSPAYISAMARGVKAPAKWLRPILGIEKITYFRLKD